MSERSLPVKALSIRQPWAWAIIYGGKDIENRTWSAAGRNIGPDGRFAVHASKGMTREEYEDAADFMSSIGVTCPPAKELLRAGIVGTVELTGECRGSSSPWFFGPVGLIMRNPQPCDFIPCNGALGFFDWDRDDAVSAPLAKWMDPSNYQAPEKTPKANPQLSLLGEVA